jgi:hypothetical protein
MRALDKIREFGRREFDITFTEEITFTFRSLSAMDFTEVHLLLSDQNFDGVAYWFQYRIYCLAKSIIAINGEELSEQQLFVLPEAQKELGPESSRELFLVEILQNWDFDAIQFLYKVWRTKCAVFTGKLIDDEEGMKRFLSLDEQKYYESVQRMQLIDQEFLRRKLGKDPLGDSLPESGGD